MQQEAQRLVLGQRPPASSRLSGDSSSPSNISSSSPPALCLSRGHQTQTVAHAQPPFRQSFPLRMSPPSLICKENHRTSTKLSTLYALYMSHLFYTHVPKYFLFWLQPGLFSRLSEKRASVPGESARGKKRRQSKERGGGEKIADSSKFGN